MSVWFFFLSDCKRSFPTEIKLSKNDTSTQAIEKFTIAGAEEAQKYTTERKMKYPATMNVDNCTIDLNTWAAGAIIVPAVNEQFVRWREAFKIF